MILKDVDTLRLWVGRGAAGSSAHALGFHGKDRLIQPYVSTASATNRVA
jgi:hypothetical protein